MDRCSIVKGLWEQLNFYYDYSLSKFGFQRILVFVFDRLEKIHLLLFHLLEYLFLSSMKNSMNISQENLRRRLSRIFIDVKALFCKQLWIPKNFCNYIDSLKRPQTLLIHLFEFLILPSMENSKNSSKKILRQRLRSYKKFTIIHFVCPSKRKRCHSFRLSIMRKIC